MDDASGNKPTLSTMDLSLIEKAGALAAQQLKVAKEIVTAGGFANASVAPILVAAVLQAIAINQSRLRS